MEKTILVDHNFIGSLSDNFEKGEEVNNNLQWVHSAMGAHNIMVERLNNIFISYYKKKINIIEYLNHIGITPDYELFYDIIFDYLDTLYSSGISELRNLKYFYYNADDDYYYGFHEEEHLGTPYSDDEFLRRLNYYRENVNAIESFDPIKNFDKAVEFYAFSNGSHKINKDQLYKGIKQPLAKMGITNTRPYIKVFKENNYYDPETDNKIK